MRDSVTALFDAVGTTPSVLGNEVLANTVVNYVLTKTGIADAYFSGASLDGEIAAAMRAGVWTSGVSAIGRVVRGQIPQLALFGDGQGAAGIAA